MQLEGHGVAVLLNNPFLSADRADTATEQITPLVTEIVNRAKREGTLRPDFEPTDAVHIQIAMIALMDLSRNVQPELYRRYLTMFFDGARADGTKSTLPVAGLSVEQSDLALRSGARSAESSAAIDDSTASLEP